MTNKYYIPKCFVKWLREKIKRFETRNHVSRLFFVVKGNNIYVQRNLNMHLKSKT